MKRISIVLVLAALATALVLTGCPPTTTTTSVYPGVTGDNLGPVVKTLAKAADAFEQGYDTVYLAGTVKIGDEETFTVPAGKTLVVTSYTDLARNIAPGDKGKITVAAGGTLTIEGDDTGDGTGVLVLIKPSDNEAWTPLVVGETAVALGGDGTLTISAAGSSGAASISFAGTGETITVTGSGVTVGGLEATNGTVEELNEDIEEAIDTANDNAGYVDGTASAIVANSDATKADISLTASTTVTAGVFTVTGYKVGTSVKTASTAAMAGTTTPVLLTVPVKDLVDAADEDTIEIKFTFTPSGGISSEVKTITVAATYTTADSDIAAIRDAKTALAGEITATAESTDAADTSLTTGFTDITFDSGDTATASSWDYESEDASAIVLSVSSAKLQVADGNYLEGEEETVTATFTDVVLVKSTFEYTVASVSVTLTTMRVTPFSLSELNGATWTVDGEGSEAGKIYLDGTTLTYAGTEKELDETIDADIIAFLGALDADDEFTVSGGEITAIEVKADGSDGEKVTAIFAAAAGVPVTLTVNGADLDGLTLAEGDMLTLGDTGVLNNGEITVGSATYNESASADITFPEGTKFIPAGEEDWAQTYDYIDVGAGEVVFAANSVLTLAEGAVLVSYAIPVEGDDPEPLTFQAGTEGDDIVITNDENSVATLEAGVFTLASNETDQATLALTGGACVSVGGDDNSVTIIGATITAGGHADSGSPTLTGAGGLFDIGAAQGEDDGGKIALADDGIITTKGTGKVTVGTGLQIGGTADTFFSAASEGTGGVTIEATDSTTTITQDNAETEAFLTLGDDEDGIVFEGLGDSAAVITLTASETDEAPVVFSGVDVTVPGNTADNKDGAILDISEKVSIALGATSGSLKFQKALSTGSKGSACFVAAENAVIIATDSGSYTKLPVDSGFGAIGSDAQDAALCEIASGNSSGTWTLADLGSGLFAAKGLEANNGAQLYAVIDYATVLVDE